MLLLQLPPRLPPAAAWRLLAASSSFAGQTAASATCRQALLPQPRQPLPRLLQRPLHACHLQRQHHRCPLQAAGRAAASVAATHPASPTPITTVRLGWATLSLRHPWPGMAAPPLALRLGRHTGPHPVGTLLVGTLPLPRLLLLPLAPEDTLALPLATVARRAAVMAAVERPAPQGMDSTLQAQLLARMLVACLLWHPAGRYLLATLALLQVRVRDTIRCGVM